MDNDDLPIGRVLSRREALSLLGAAGALLVLGCSSDGDATTPSTTDGTCVVKPELTEGPYYVDEELNRSGPAPESPPPDRPPPDESPRPESICRGLLRRRGKVA